MSGVKYRPSLLASGATKPRSAQDWCLSCPTTLRRLADPLAQVASTNQLVLPKEPLPKLLGPERDGRSRATDLAQGKPTTRWAAQGFHPSLVAAPGHMDFG